eukprot:1670062-Rhodomonas_salina.2
MEDGGSREDGGWSENGVRMEDGGWRVEDGDEGGGRRRSHGKRGKKHPGCRECRIRLGKKTSGLGNADAGLGNEESRLGNVDSDWGMWMGNVDLHEGRKVVGVWDTELSAEGGHALFHRQRTLACHSHGSTNRLHWIPPPMHWSRTEDSGSRV